MTPPSSLARNQALEKWRGEIGPMKMQQQRREHEPLQQMLRQQRNSGKPAPVSTDKAEQIRKDLEKKGQVLPDGQKKKPLPGETTGAA